MGEGRMLEGANGRRVRQMFEGWGGVTVLSVHLTVEALLLTRFKHLYCLLQRYAIILK